MDSLSTLRALLDQGPSEAAWAAVCKQIAGIDGAPALEAALGLARERLGRWPARLRRVDLPGPEPGARWLAGLLRGECDPRLETVGWASVHDEVEHGWEGDPILGDAGYPTYGPGPGFPLRVRPIVLAFARHLQPGFDPPEVQLRYENNTVSAYGCGGGTVSEVWGDAERGLSWQETITEHPSSDSSDGAWSVYGLDGGLRLRFGDRERGTGMYWFEAEGPAPGVLELALAWGALLRGGQPWALEMATEQLEAARVPWRGRASG